MGYNNQYTQASASISQFGVARTITAGAASTDNASALAAGRYLFRVETESIRVRGPVAEGTAATATDMLFEAGDVFYVDIGSEAAEQFVSVIRGGAADATVTVCGTSPNTSAAQPPAWS